MTFVEEGRRAEPGRAMPWAVLEGLISLIRCDIAGFTEFDMRHKVKLTEQFAVDPGERLQILEEHGDPSHPYWALWRDFRPAAQLTLHDDLTCVVKYSDFYTLPELRSTPFFSEINKGDHLRRIALALPAAPGRTRRVLLDRELGPDFTERDRLVLQLLRPHLYEIYLAAHRRRTTIPQLSHRELQVLQLAAQGYSNGDIARMLFVAVSTVRKHMEHIFDRTGVRSRTAAAALVLPHLSVVDPH
jgi:DNA-binding CsgD family transcriptional regulator